MTAPRGFAAHTHPGRSFPHYPNSTLRCCVGIRVTCHAGPQTRLNGSFYTNTRVHAVVQAPSSGIWSLASWANSGAFNTHVDYISLRGQAQSVMPTRKAMRYIDEAPWGPTLRYTSFYFNSRTLFSLPKRKRHRFGGVALHLFPIPERSVMRPQLNDIYCPPKPCYMALWSRIGLPQVDSLVVTSLSRQSAHGAPYVIDGPGVDQTSGQL